MNFFFQLLNIGAKVFNSAYKIYYHPGIQYHCKYNRTISVDVDSHERIATLCINLTYFGFTKMTLFIKDI